VAGEEASVTTVTGCQGFLGRKNGSVMAACQVVNIQTPPPARAMPNICATLMKFIVALERLWASCEAGLKYPGNPTCRSLKGIKL
jgi:hypothetical protein